MTTLTKFIVKGTIFDQGSTNITDLNLLKGQTAKQYTILKLENRNFGFEIDENEIIPLFDPPHLIKDLPSLYLNVFMYIYQVIPGSSNLY